MNPRNIVIFGFDGILNSDIAIFSHDLYENEKIMLSLQTSTLKSGKMYRLAKFQVPPLQIERKEPLVTHIKREQISFDVLK